MGTKQLATILKARGWEIRMSPTDGHCLLHSFITAYHNQLPLLHKPSLESITRGIRDEVNTNSDDYLAFGLSMASLQQEMEKLYSK